MTSIETKVKPMADFDPNIDIQRNVWTDITVHPVTGTDLTGLDVVVQNSSSSDMRIWFGPTAPTDPDQGIALPPHNWPALFGTVHTKVWVYGVGDVHISEAD